MTQAQIYIYGIDLGKNWFHLVAMDRMEQVLTKQKLTRSQLKQFISTTPPCRVAFGACPGSQYWGRLFQQAGFEPKIIPPQFVKPYLKSNKNDFNDATAIAEAGNRGTMRCVPLKSHEQLALQRLIASVSVSSSNVPPLSIRCERCCWNMGSPCQSAEKSSSAPYRRSLKMPRMACLTLSTPWYYA